MLLLLVDHFYLLAEVVNSTEVVAVVSYSNIRGLDGSRSVCEMPVHQLGMQ